jgi:hypothetical protein
MKLGWIIFFEFIPVSCPSRDSCCMEHSLGDDKKNTEDSGSPRNLENNPDKAGCLDD